MRSISRLLSAARELWPYYLGIALASVAVAGTTLLTPFIIKWATDEVVVGDWDGNGTTTPGVRRGTTFFLKNDFTGGGADVTFTFGELGDKVIVGKFTAGDSKETVGVYRPTAL